MMARKEKVDGGIPSGLIGYYQDPNDPSRIAGFYGEVESKDFITAVALHTAVADGAYGNATGNDVGWFKFYLDGKILYAPIAPTWHNASAAGFDAMMNKTITIREKRYLVRHWGVLPAGRTSADTPVDFKGSEAGRLFPNITDPIELSYPTVLEGGTWAKNSVYRMNGGNYDWRMSDATSRYMAGSTPYQLMWQAACYVTGNTIGNSDSLNAWYPCLEQLD